MAEPSQTAEDSSPFRLTKWYLDCVADNGDGVVVYVADLRWKSWHVRYASAMLFFDDVVTTRSSIRNCVLPESNDDKISLKLPHLKLEGTWNRRAAAVGRSVFAHGEQEIRWNCLQPASDGKVVLNGSMQITGLGYAERLDMSMAPWNLPLDELYWGRFVGQRNHVVWIDWSGQHCFRLLVHNGTSYASASISEKEISHDALTLQLDQGLTLRRGSLGKTVLPSLAQLSKVLPGSLFNIEECKWRSRSVLTTGTEKEEGWSIHEVVRWRQP